MIQGSPNIKRIKKHKNKPPWRRSGGKKKRGKKRKAIKRSRTQHARDHALDFQGLKARSHTTSTRHPRKFAPWSPARCRAILRSL